MASAPFPGYGATVTANSFSGTITRLSHDGVTRPSIDVTHFASNDGYKEFIPGWHDFGSIKIDGFLDPTAGPPAVGGDAENVSITFADTNTSTWAFSGFISDATGFDAPLDGAITRSVTIKISGNITAS